MFGASFARFGMASRSENSCKISCSWCRRQLLASFETAAESAPSALPQKKRRIAAWATRTNLSPARILFLPGTIFDPRFRTPTVLAPHSTQLGRRTVDLFPGLGPAAEMFGQELFHPSVEIEVILRPRETMAFVGINHVGHFALRFAQRRHHCI